MNTGDLNDRFLFYKPGEGTGEGGNTHGEAAPLFATPRWANRKPINGGDEVMAGRLTSSSTVVLTFLNLKTTREGVDTECIVEDVRTKERFAIAEIKETGPRREWLEMLCRSNVVGAP
jgi:hypothetical protein